MLTDLECREMEHLRHFTHKHRLIFFEYKSRAGKQVECSAAEDPADIKKSYRSADEEEEAKIRCIACGDGLDGPSYRCRYSCKFYLHKACAELKLDHEIDHPLHPSHPLIFLAKAPYADGANICNFCCKRYFGFVYHCDSCDFDLDINCALLQSSTENFHELKHSFHDHPLMFNEKYNKKEDACCLGCRKKLSTGPIYRCLECSYLDNYFDLHKECAELPLEIDHFYHRKHPLTLLPNQPDHPDTFSSSICEKDWDGFVYYCSICMFGLTLEDVLPPNMATIMSHQHQWTPLSRLMSFTCDFCGTEGHRSPHLCTTCNLVVHKDCISLPHTIKITRHHHRISHIYSLLQKKLESKECRICYNEVNIAHGSYSCSVSDCNYIAHAKCATHEEIWDADATTLSEEEEAPHESLTLISAVIKEMRQGEVVIATEIKHEYHEHNLILTLSGQVKNDVYCDGCMRVISNPFYSCEKCSFFLHKNCAELPRQKQHPSHTHLLSLTNDSYAFCNACHRYHHGFSYECGKYCYFMIDIQCSLLSDTLSHPSHEHLLFLDYKYQGSCSACPDKNARQVYTCVKRCGFMLDFWCITLPQVAWYKYDKHPLTLTYNNDDFDATQLYCDICEEERHPSQWFYYCEKCDTSVHTKCVLGALPFIKPESTYKHRKHPHQLTFVKNIWNCPRCNICHQLCYGQALECKESDECNLIVHWNCRRSLKRPSE